MIKLDKLRESEGYILAIVNTKTGEYVPVRESVMQVIRCKYCLRKRYCMVYRETNQENGFCAWGLKEEE